MARPNPNGRRPVAQGKSPAGPLYIPCPWHMEGQEHPPGAPPCQTPPDNLKMKLMSVGPLVAWLALMVGDMAKMLAHMLKALAGDNQLEAEVTGETPADLEVVDGSVAPAPVQAEVVEDVDDEAE